jgi:DNA-binding SARP family transcriptional activator
MIRVIFLLILLFAIKSNSNGQTYGLAFNSHESVQEKRTALDLTPDDSICIGNNLKLEFDLNFMMNHEVYFGYVVRVVNDQQNIDIISTQNTFRVVVGQQATNISFSIDTLSLYNQWNKFVLELDFKQQRLRLTVNGKEMGNSPVSLPGTCFKLLWGANDHHRFNTRDIPPMRIKDIKLYEQNDLKYHWTLADTGGTTSIDRVHKKAAIIKNPVWIKPKHQYWQLASSFTLKGNAGIAFDGEKDRLFIAGADSVWIYKPRNSTNAWSRNASSYGNLLLGNQAIYDTLTDQLYDVFIDQKKVAAYNELSNSWHPAFQNSILTEYWHANKFISPVDSALYIIGGYGQLKYKNIVQRHDLNTGQWETVATHGDVLPPRYLAALGTNQAGDTAFIMGGYGSQTGDQMLNPANYYDLYAYDIRRKSFKKLHSLDSSMAHFVFANSLVIDSKSNSYYGLIFQNGSFDTHLQLVRGSLDKEGFDLVGSPIPYSFYDIQSYADLFYSSISRKLIAVTLFYSKESDPEKSTQVRIYTLDFPPESLAAVTVADSKPGYWLYIIFGILAIVGIVILVKKSIGNKQSLHARPSAPPKIENIPNQDLPVTADATPRILLFGEFFVIDKDRADITKSFTPLLKELFLLILIYTARNNKGISSEALNELLWHDKTLKDAKNNRSVNIAKLKTILEKIGNCSVQKEDGFWQFRTEPESVLVDYQQFVKLCKEDIVPDKVYMKKLLNLAGRGTFLSQTDYNWLDDIKSEISNGFINIGIKYMSSVNLADDAEFVIEVANCIFYFDRLNEHALQFKCRSLSMLKRHALANTTYLNFTREYQEMYGEEFGTPFNEIVK